MPRTDHGSERQRMVRWPEMMLLSYVMTAAALITLAPFGFAYPHAPHIRLEPLMWDSATNVLFFVPLGFLFRLTWPGLRAPLVTATVGGFAFSLTLETGQLFVPQRVSAVSDLIANALGAGVGAALAGGVRDWISARLPALLSLEHPLVNLLYLLIPLQWLGGMKLEHGARMAVGVPLGLAGACALAAIWRYRFSHYLTRRYLLLVTASWYVVAAAPGWIEAPIWAALSGVVVLIGAWFAYAAFERRTPTFPRPEGRVPSHRVEGAALRAIVPLVVAFLLALVMLGASGGQPSALAWPDSFYLSGFQLNGPYRFQVSLRIVEYAVGLTVFGYVLGQLMGRTDWSGRRNTLVFGALAIGAVFVLEVLYSFGHAGALSVIRISVGVAAAAYGYAIYRLQLSAILILRGPSRATGSPDEPRGGVAGQSESTTKLVPGRGIA